MFYASDRRFYNASRLCANNFRFACQSNKRKSQSKQAKCMFSIYKHYPIKLTCFCRLNIFCSQCSFIQVSSMLTTAIFSEQMSFRLSIYIALFAGIITFVLRSLFALGFFLLTAAFFLALFSSLRRSILSKSRSTIRCRFSFLYLPVVSSAHGEKGRHSMHTIIV